ncbi:MAG: PhoH family protein [Ignavibacteria bacterium]
MTEKNILLNGFDLFAFCGVNDSNLNHLKKLFPDSYFVLRGDNLFLKSPSDSEIGFISRIIDELIILIKRQNSLSVEDIDLIFHLLNDNNNSNGSSKNGSVNRDIIFVNKNDIVKPKNSSQINYLNSVLNNEIVFAIGPAGTGKTYLAVAFAIVALNNKQVSKVVLARPAVEAGESLGFLPGDLSEKIDPYLKPLFDALEAMLPLDKLNMFLEKNIIEIVPLAYMRGRTLNDAFVILDEAQNATTMQMKMFLTRLGPNSKAIITGDITQIDLPRRDQSGLIQVEKILKGIDGVDFVYFEKSDVVRHRLVKEIINAYEKFVGNGSDVNK